MRGIDISNWQAGLIPSALDIDFCICKATGGTHFVDPSCDGFIQNCIQHSIPWGFYHFANDGIYSDPSDEARFFISNCDNYFCHGIPILDWEVDVDVNWVNRFVNIVHSETGIWPWIYANPWRFNQGSVESNCMRWVASYPDWYRPPLRMELPDPPETDGLVGAWQFASDGQVDGYDGNLDVDVFYGDLTAWCKYGGIAIKPKPQPEPQPEPQRHIMEDDDYKITIERKK